MDMDTRNPRPEQDANAPLARFLKLAEQQIRPDRPESLWTLQEDFRELADEGLATRLVNGELERIRQNPSHMGDWRPNQFMIHRGRGWTLSLWLIEETRRYIHSSSSLALYAPVGTQSLRYGVYRLPADYRNSTFDPAVTLEPAGTGITAPGGVLRIEADRLVYDFTVERPVAVLKLATASFQPLEWLFDRGSLRARQANDSELAWTQVRVAAYILGRLADPSSLEPLQELSSHPHHAVRWAAIQNLGRLSRRAAVARLEQGVNDPHPHVRRAAARALQQLSPKA